MKSLSDHYEKEARLLKAVKNAATYPGNDDSHAVSGSVRAFYKGNAGVLQGYMSSWEPACPPAAAAAIRLGGILSGAALVAGSCNWRSCWP